MDAVFFPLIPPDALKQEGWRYDLENLDGQLSYQGVVFNEMKGVYSSPDSLLSRSSQQVLFPDHTYGVDSGGDPEQIPSLTYEQFKSFHSTYYHPSNAYIFFYGDDDPDERLRRMNEYLEGFERLEVGSSSRSSWIEQTCPAGHSYDAGKDEDRSASPRFCDSQRLNGTQDAEDLAYNILAYLWLGHPPPAAKGLDRFWPGEDLTGVGLENGLRRCTTRPV
jgi:Zn-dependent M16 (insulinase) family peptidase